MKDTDIKSTYSIKEKIKNIISCDQKIIELIVVSLINGWAICSNVRGISDQIASLSGIAQENFMKILTILAIFTVVCGIIYVLNDQIARLLLFVNVYLFLFMCAYNSYNVNWETDALNTIGKTCFLAVLCFFAVITYIYVKDDVHDIIKEVRLGDKKTNILVIIIGAMFVIVVGIATVYRYKGYVNSTFDFGIFAQMYEHMRQTGKINTTVERNFLLSHFGVHFSPIFYLFLPIYAIFPTPETIQLIQAVAVAVPLLPIVLLCRHYNLSNKITLAMALLYVLYPATAGGTMYDIHENCFLVFFLLMTIWAVETNKKLALVILAVLTLMIKEDAAIYLLIVGAYFLFSRKSKIRGGVLMLASVIYFVVAVSIVNSFGLGVLDSHFSNLYFDANGGIVQMIQSLISNPAYALGQIIENASEGGMDKIEYLILMLTPVTGALFAIKKKYSKYILLMPFLVINLVATYLYQHSIMFHYNFATIALFMYLIIMNLSEMKHKKATKIVTISVICAAIMFMGTILPKTQGYVERYAQGKENYMQMDEILAKIPEEASVCASGYLVPHLANHLELYDQGHLNEDIYTDYLVVDARYATEKAEFDQILATGDYELVESLEGTVEVYRLVD